MRNYHYAKEGEVMYHTGLTKEQLAGARYAVVPGDPGRVPGLAKALDPAAVFSPRIATIRAGLPASPVSRCLSCRRGWAGRA